MSDEATPYPVPVVRLIVPNAEGRVLILRRSVGSTAGGSWCLPGGKIDYGDTVETAASRELQEETSLRPTHLQFLFYQDSLPLGSGRMHCINLYLLCETEGDLRINNESTEAVWIARDELSSYPLAFRNDEGLAKYWKNS